MARSGLHICATIEHIMNINDGPPLCRTPVRLSFLVPARCERVRRTVRPGRSLRTRGARDHGHQQRRRQPVLLRLATVHNFHNSTAATISVIKPARLSVAKCHPATKRIFRQRRGLNVTSQRRPDQRAAVQRTEDRTGSAPGYREPAGHDCQHRQRLCSSFRH